MEPMLEEAERSLDDLTSERTRVASMLAGRLHPAVQEGIGARAVDELLLFEPDRGP